MDISYSLYVSRVSEASFLTTWGMFWVVFFNVK